MRAGVTRREIFVLALLLFAAAWFRFRLVASWHAPAGDGTEYYNLSQELRQHDRYAHGLSQPLTFVRLPGYPMFLSYVAVRKAPIPMEEHVVQATRWNVLLDLGTALVIFFLLRERRVGTVASYLGLVAVLVCPIIMILCCYALTESLNTFLLTLTFALAVRATRSRYFLYAALAGATAAMAQLVRTTSVVVLVPVVWALLSADVPWKKRAQAVFLCGVTAWMVFLPWPLRNYIQFGNPYPLGTEWMTLQGDPLPPGLPRWTRTWASGAPGESYVNLMVVLHRTLDARPGTLPPVMYDDEAEKQKILAIYERYNREYFSPAVDRAFDELASERTKRHPFRTLVKLPLQRIVSLWTPIPEYELGMRTRLLDLPAKRRWFVYWRILLSAFALVGAVVLSRRDRLLLTLCLTPIGLTSVMIAYLHAFPVERYLAPVMPLMMALTGVGAAAIFGRKWPVFNSTGQS